MTREEVLAQIHDAKEQGDPIGPYKLGDDANLITDFLASYQIKIDADGGVVDLLEAEDDDEPEDERTQMIVYEPRSVSGELATVDDVPEELQDEPDWAVVEVGDGGEVEVIVDGLTYAEAEEFDGFGTEIIDWFAYAADNYRITSDAADERTAAEPRWVVARWFMRGDEYVYDPITDPMTLAEAMDYDESDLGVLIASAESTDDYEERERIIDEIGPLVREQIATA